MKVAITTQQKFFEIVFHRQPPLLASKKGTVGLDWQFAGVAPVRGAGTSDLVLRNVNASLFNINTGVFEVYDISIDRAAAAAHLGTSAWNGSWVVLPLILRSAPQAAPMAQPLNSCRQWPASARMQPTTRMAPLLGTTRHSRRY